MPLNPKAKFEITASDKTRKGLSSARARFNQTAKTVAKYGTVIGTVAVAATAKLTAAQFKVIDSTAKLSDRIGSTTERIIGLRHAAELTGGGSERLSEAIDVLQKRLGEAATGTGQAKDALEQLGLSAQELLGMDPAEQFRMISERVSQLSNQQEKSAATSDLFSRANIKLVNTLELGRKGLDEVQQRAEDLNLTYSRFDAAKIEQANDAITESKTAFTGLGNTIAIRVAPFVTAMAEGFTEAAAEGKGFSTQVDSALQGTIKVIGFVADAVHGLKIVFLAVRNAVAEMFNFMLQSSQKVNNAIASTVNPILEFLGRDPLEFRMLNDMADSFTETVKRFRSELEEAAMEKLPSTKLNEGVQEAMDEANRNAAKTAAEQQGNRGGPDPAIPGGGLTEEKVQTQLERIKRFTMSRREIEIADHQQRREFVMQNMAEGEQRRKLLEKLEAKHQKNLTEIAEKGTKSRTKLNEVEWQSALSTIGGAMNKLTNLMDSNSKDSFERKKKAAKATAIVSTASAVVQSFENAGGYPWGLIPAGLMLAAGLKQIENINKQQYNGGGAVSGGSVSGGGGGTTSTTPPRQAQQQVPRMDDMDRDHGGGSTQIIINGAITEDMINEVVVPAMQKGIKNRDIVLIDRNSRQAQEIREAG